MRGAWGLESSPVIGLGSADLGDGLPAARPSLAYVVSTLNMGGTERLVVDMSLAFAGEFDVVVLCLDEPGVWASELRAAGVPVHCLWRQPGLDLSMPFRLAACFRRFGSRIVHAHQYTPWFYAALSRLLHPSPRLLFEEHGRFYPEVRRPKRIMANRLLIRNLTHRFVAVSKDVRSRLVQFDGLEARKITVVYNGVKPNQQLNADERRGLREALGFGPSDFVVGTVGRFDPIKNLPMLVASLRAVAAKRSELRGLLVGEGPMFAEIRSLAVRTGMEGRIRFTGFRNDARRLVQCMDLFVLPSFSEGTSIALLEAMAASIPAAVTDVGGSSEVVVAGETGWVVPSGSHDGLSAAIEDALTDREKLGRYAAAAQRRFAECFAFDRMVESYRDLYRDLLGKTDGRALQA